MIVSARVKALVGGREGGRAMGEKLADKEEAMEGQDTTMGPHNYSNDVTTFLLSVFASKKENNHYRIKQETRRYINLLRVDGAKEGHVTLMGERMRREKKSEKANNRKNASKTTWSVEVVGNETHGLQHSRKTNKKKVVNW